MKKFLSLFALVFFSGCAYLAPRDHEYVWTMSDRPALPSRVEVVEEWPDVVKNSICSEQSILHACAVYYWIPETKEYTECVIYTKYKFLPKYLLEHEEKHCQGWDHN